jgi:hypothetical protein
LQQTVASSKSGHARKSGRTSSLLEEPRKIGDRAGAKFDFEQELSGCASSSLSHPCIVHGQANLLIRRPRQT